jgi:hypothetical protein
VNLYVEIRDESAEDHLATYTEASIELKTKVTELNVMLSLWSHSAFSVAKKQISAAIKSIGSRGEEQAIPERMYYI